MSSVVKNINRVMFFKLAILFFILNLSFAYTTSIHVPAVLGNTNTGIISSIQLNLSKGNGTVKILGPLGVGESTLSSAQIGVAYASNFTGINESKYNFTYTIFDNSSNVTGPSGGLAFTILAISAIKQVPIKDNFTLTGTISSSGVVGQIGGITDKVSAAKSYGLKYILAPEVPNQSFEDTLYYLSQQLNNIPIIEVGNVSTALQYVLVNESPIITPLQYTLYAQNYYLNKLNNAPFTCKNICNTTLFGNLVNYTFNMTSSEISSISNNFSSIKPQLFNMLSTYKNISDKGYLYTGADMAFLEYINAYMFANSNNYTLGKAYSLLSNVNNYCNGLVAPQLTTQNYEYIISGEARQGWAIQNLKTAKTELNQSQSTDDIVSAIGTIAESNAWCNAANNLYMQAVASNGTQVGLSGKIYSLVSKILLADKVYNGSMYYNAAVSEFNSGEYGAALYSLNYVSSISGTPSYPSNYSISTLYSALNSSLYGIWPIEYANSAAFYAEEANLSSNNLTKLSYLDSSYPLAILSEGISTLNMQISSNFTSISMANNKSSGNTYINSTQLMGIIGEEAISIRDLEATVSTLKVAIELIVVMIFIFLVALLYFIIKDYTLKKEILLQSKSRTRRR